MVLMVVGGRLSLAGGRGVPAPLLHHGALLLPHPGEGGGGRGGVLVLHTTYPLSTSMEWGTSY